VRRVLHDEHSEQKIWSSLVLAWGERPEVLIQDIQESHLPHLEGLIVQHLRALENPPRPTFGVAAAGRFQLLAAFLNEHGPVIQLDLDGDPRIPEEIDVLFWMQPAAITPQHGRVRRFVESGRSAVLAGSAYEIEYLLEEDEARYAARLLPPAWEELLRPLGLRPVADLLLDANIGPVLLDAGERQLREVEAPFHLRVLPVFYNMKSFLLPARGGLNFAGAAPLEVDTRQAAQAGFQAEIVGTTTENARVLPLPQEPFANADLQAGLSVPKQNLMVLLKSDDPWQGQVFVLASASPLRDGFIEQAGYAHRVFLQNLVRTFAAPERLVRSRVERAVPGAIPSMGTSARLFWRCFAVFLVPLLLLAVGLRRYGGAWPFRRWPVDPLARLGAGLLLLLVGAYLWRSPGSLYLDLSADRLNTPTPLTLRLLEEQTTSVEADLVVLPRALLPPALKSVEDRVRALLDRGDIPVRLVRPGALPLHEQQELLDQGLRPFSTEQVVHDTLATRQAWSGLRLRQEGRAAVIPRLDGHTINHLEFLLATALRRLEQGRAPRVAVFSDLPRLSPAEALEDYQKKNLMAPGGADVYGQLKGLLADYLYEVYHVNPRDPALPDSIDVFLWLQPRRDSGPVQRLLADHLARGGRAMVALQHFNIQQRQYRGAGFETVYWPQPQFQDLDPFLRLLGLEQVREVLMDRTRAHLELETQVNRTAVREYDPQKVALPFLIRAVGENFAPQSPLTRHLGDLLFIWGNRFALDEERLSRLGLQAQVLISTSDRSWSYPWQGGWLPPEIFSADSYLPGRQPLSVLVKGSFPPVAWAEGGPQALPAEAARPEGALLLIGSSEMFKNDHLYAPNFQHDQLLLNAVALLAYGEELAALQARRPAQRGFPVQSPVARALWRAGVVAAGPLLFLAWGLVRYHGRHSGLRWP
jgi:hypothetical protein